MKSTELKPNYRVLIIDDNPGIHQDFRNILCPDQPDARATEEMEAVLFDEQAPAAPAPNFELDSAYQGQEGLERVQRSVAEGRPYALAFVDVRMPPGWDGIETIAHLWKVDPNLEVVVCTAYADYSWQEMRAKVGQPDNLLVLKKPFDNIEVQQLTNALTKKWLLNVRTQLQVAELKQTNELLAVSEQRFGKAFHDSPLPSAIQALQDGRFVDINRRFLEVAGYSREQMIGRTAEELALWERPEVVAHWYAALQRQEEVRDQEAKLRHHSGALREMVVSLSPLTVNGQVQIMLVAQDVSERALLERQLRQAQKMEAIGQLAAGVAHDFNNILTVVQGHAGLLLHLSDPASRQAKSLKEISEAAGRAATLIRQLLMFSRKQVMQFRHFNLNDILNHATKMLQRLVGEHVQIQFQPAPSLPSIYADSSMVEQIVMNFAVNARDAMPSGGLVSIVTSLETVRRGPTPMDPEPRNGEFVCLTFRDTGLGMNTEVLSRIFEPFFTTKAVGKGTGLGLSTVFGIVRQHRGWLEVESKPNAGTSFRVYFPATRQLAEKIEHVVDTTLCKGRETVLVAEDEDALRQMVVQVLRVQGYKVLEAASGREALDIWAQSNQQVDLLLTDLVMPGGVMGSDLAERLSGQNPRLKVIYTSGYSPGMAGKDASLLQRRNFLPKPYSIGKLAHLVRKCLDAPQPESAASLEPDARAVEQPLTLPSARPPGLTAEFPHG